MARKSETVISRRSFSGLLRSLYIREVKSPGCNVIQFRTIEGTFEIESITENGVPSFAFYRRENRTRKKKRQEPAV